VGRTVPWTDVDTGGRRGPLDDVVGPHWSIVSTADPTDWLGAASRQLLEQIKAVAARAVPEGPILRLLLDHEVAIVRPDRIIYGVSSLPGLDALVERLKTSLGGGATPRTSARQ
jgi:hypothetical protein